MIKRLTEIDNFKRGDKNISAIYRANTLIWPLTPPIPFSSAYVGDFNNVFLKADYTAKIIMLNDDLTKDSVSFGTGFFTGINGAPSTYVDNDNKILVFRGFNNPGYDGVAYTNRSIVRLVLDIPTNKYIVDPTFTPAVFDTQNINNIYQYPDGKYLVSGPFRNVNSVRTDGLVRLNSDGSVDNTFITSNTMSVTPTHRFMFQGTKIILVNAPIGYLGSTQRGLVRLNSDGSLDTTFNTGNTGLSGDVSMNCFVRTDNKIVMVKTRTATTYNGVTGRLFLLNEDGTVSNSYTNSINDDVIPNVYNLSDDSFYLYSFVVSGWLAGGLCKINNDFTLNSTFNVGTGVGNSLEIDVSLPTVSTLFINGSNELIVGGNFGTYNGVSVNRIIKVNKDTGALIQAPKIFNNTVNNIIRFGTNKLLVTGNFLTYNFDFSRGITLVRDTELEPGFDTGLGFRNTISALQIFSTLPTLDSGLLVGGNFNFYKTTSINRIVKLDINGNIDTSFNVGTGFNGTVFDIVYDNLDNTKYIVSGNFTTYNGVVTGPLVRLNSDGSLDLTFTPISAFIANRIVPVTNGYFIVAESASERLRKINNDGSTDTSFTSPGFNNTVRDVVELSSGGYMVVGDFTNASYPRIVRLNANGTVNTSFVMGSSFNSNVFSIKQDNDGKLIVVGIFSTYKGVSFNRIIKLDLLGNIDFTFNPGTGFFGSSLVTDVRVIDGNYVVLHQNGTYYNGNLTPFIAVVDTTGNLVSNGDYIVDNNIRDYGRIIR